MIHALSWSGRRLVPSLFGSSVMARASTTVTHGGYEAMSRVVSMPISCDDPEPYSVNVLEGTTGRFYGSLLALGGCLGEKGILRRIWIRRCQHVQAHPLLSAHDIKSPSVRFWLKLSARGSPSTAQLD